MHRINHNGVHKEAIRRYLLYVLLGLVILFTSYLFVLATLGYGIGSDGRLISNGLLVINTEPKGAEIRVDGVKENSRTPSQLPLRQGRYSIELNKPGYRPWNSEVWVEGGKVLWVDHAKLVNAEFEQTKVEGLEPDIANSIFIENLGLILAEVSTAVNLGIVDAGSGRLKFQQDISSRLRVGPAGNFGEIELHRWGLSTSKLLVVQRLDDIVDHRVIDVTDLERSFSISAKYGQIFDKITATANEQVFYSLSGGRLSRHDLRTSGQQVIASDVGAIAYGTEGQALYVLDKSGTRLRKLDDSSTDLVEYASFDTPISSMMVSSYESHEYVSLARPDNRLAVYRIPKGDKQGAAPVVPEKLISFEYPVKEVSHSYQGRFILAKTGSGAKVYDLEFNRVNSLELYDSLRWVDDTRLSFMDNGNLVISDYDGSNEYVIGPANNKIMPVAANRGMVIYYSAPSLAPGGASVVVSTKLNQ